MALILLCSKRLATFWDTEKDQAMQHHNSVFHSVLKQFRGIALISLWMSTGPTSMFAP